MTPAPAVQPSLPWALPELVRLLSVSALGATCVFGGWAGCSSTGNRDTGMLWLVVGIVGLVLEGSGVATWLLLGTRRVRSRQNALLEPLVEQAARRQEAASSRELDTLDLVSAVGMTRYHRVDCELVVGKPVQRASLSRHLAKGRRACGVCAQ